MDSRVSQHLRIQPGEYVIEHLSQAAVPPSSADWLALVRAPEGLTIVRRPAVSEEPAGGRWVAFYSGQTAHDLDMPGMLAAVVNPLAQAALSLFVTSTYHADLVFVQAEHRHEAAEILRRAGHVVQDTVDGRDLRLHERRCPIPPHQLPGEPTNRTTAVDREPPSERAD